MVKAYVNRFTVSSAENKEELRLSLQTLLMSRLNSTGIQTVENQSDAEIQIAGSYIVFGTIFSLDALIKTSAGVFIDRVFVQGDTMNELIPAVTEMANQLRRAIFKWNPTLSQETTGNTLTLPTKKIPNKPLAAKGTTRVETVPVYLPKEDKLSEKPWISHRLPEVLTGIASGRTIANKGVEVFVSGERYLRYYLKADSLQFLSAVVFEADEKIVGVDVADLDKNGVPEVYVSLLKGGLPASQVYIPENNVLKKIVGDLPYMLRSIALEGNEPQVFAQKIDTGGNFTGNVSRLSKSDDNFTTDSPLQLPSFANLYNFNQFSDSKGKQLFIVGHPEGYLLVYSKERKLLWKSRDKFGGSEAITCQSDKISTLPLAPSCSFTPPQRLLTTKSGDVVASRNSGSTNSGSRGFSKNSVVRFSWNGTSLQEKWRTGQSQNYLADFSYDDHSKELLLLEVEPKDDTQAERGSRLVMRKVE